MPKVIGFDPKIEKTCSCYNCAAILTYTPSCIKESKEMDYLGDVEYIKYINCPNCGYNVTVSQ